MKWTDFKWISKTWLHWLLDPFTTISKRLYKLFQKYTLRSVGRSLKPGTAGDTHPSDRASWLRLRGCSRHPTIRQTSHQHDTISPGLESDSASEWGRAQRSALQTGGKASSHSLSGHRGLTQTCSAGFFGTRTGGGTDWTRARKTTRNCTFSPASSPKWDGNTEYFIPP